MHEKVSKFISLILRHKPEAIGISLDEHGWANTDELIEGVSKTYPIDMSVLEEIVLSDEKQRYSFNEDKTLIRANQGHSILVDVELSVVKPPEYLFHGTATKYIDSIRERGLISKSRLYVHLSEDKETASTVGQRHGDPFVYRIRSGEMYRDGAIFYKSKNGIWLTKNVPVNYLEKESFVICHSCYETGMMWERELPFGFFRTMPHTFCHKCLMKLKLTTSEED